MKNDIENMKA